MHMCARASMRICVNVCVRARGHACTLMDVCAHRQQNRNDEEKMMPACVCACTRTHSFTHAEIEAQTHTHAHARTHAHTHAHTHARVNQSADEESGMRMAGSLGAAVSNQWSVGNSRSLVTLDANGPKRLRTLCTQSIPSTRARSCMHESTHANVNTHKHVMDGNNNGWTDRPIGRQAL